MSIITWYLKLFNFFFLSYVKERILKNSVSFWSDLLIAEQYDSFQWNVFDKLCFLIVISNNPTFSLHNVSEEGISHINLKFRIKNS